MTATAIGFEGTGPGSHPISWGVAAIRLDNRVVNAATRVELSDREYRELVDAGSICPMPEPVPIEDVVARGRVLVVRVNAHGAGSECIGVLRKYAVGEAASDAAVFLVIADPDRLAEAAGPAVQRLLEVLFGQWDDHDAVRVLLMAALTLDPTDPETNAVWCFSRPSVRRVAARHASVAPHGEARFLAMEDALRHTAHDVVTLKYTGGAADRGRFPVGASVAASVALENVYSVEAANVARDYRLFRGKVPELVWEERAAASVDWRFRTQDDDGFRAQLARTLVWLRVQRHLRNGADNIDDPVIRDAYSRLIRPEPDAVLDVGFAGTEFRAPRVARRAEMEWFKRLARSEALVVRPGTREIQFLRLIGGEQDVPYATWFREVFFGALEWQDVEKDDGHGSVSEVEMETTVQGVYFGSLTYGLDHWPHRSRSHHAPPTYLRWNEHVLAAFRKGFFAGAWVSLSLQNGTYSMVISTSRPG